MTKNLTVDKSNLLLNNIKKTSRETNISAFIDAIMRGNKTIYKEAIKMTDMEFFEEVRDTKLAQFYKNEGVEEGMEKGMEEGIRLTACNLKRSGMPSEKISEYTGLSLNTINSL
ncbi:MAG: hypothetical protein Ta2B_30660 [Termitinemataceae bacterium]|nr:MAG: hypothetical protein Ta2B_30660 [Termitinemataceae bacterium]